ncbi:hypothetical protein L596_028791 [Steinernema carpocapsae]|uniref:Uncharacterized protein n=1 Tax=Steinernema carpocapsae TaxID=34508 RepID=A0A4U5LZD4_STECR|nr:hypothetical protein L596_028791 [Steinernema carpocapsae]
MEHRERKLKWCVYFAQHHQMRYSSAKGIMNLPAQIRRFNAKAEENGFGVLFILGHGFEGGFKCQGGHSMPFEQLGQLMRGPVPRFVILNSCRGIGRPPHRLFHKVVREYYPFPYEIVDQLSRHVVVLHK